MEQEKLFRFMIEHTLAMMIVLMNKERFCMLIR